VNNKNTIAYAPETQSGFDVAKMEEVLDSKCDGPNGLAVFTIMHSIRRSLPYGKWTTANGTEVLFNREYQPFVKRKDGTVTYIDRNTWIKDIVKTEMYYDDSNAPAGFIASKFGFQTMSARDRKASKRSLLICLTVLRDFTPKEDSSVNSVWSLLG
jgi:hypothetical protein